MKRNYYFGRELIFESILYELYISRFLSSLKSIKYFVSSNFNIYHYVHTYFLNFLIILRIMKILIPTM